MLAYNGSVPGPTLKVAEGSEIDRQRREPGRPRGDRPLARAAARQPLRRHARDAAADGRRRALPVPPRSSPTPASTGTTRTSARTTARSWASTATSSSSPADPDYWPPAHRELAAHARRHPDRGRAGRAVQPRPRRRYSAMGRFGNVMLVSGETELALTARGGEVVRLYLTNTANTRVFKVAAAGGADEARRRRQRPGRARGARRRRRARAVRARRRRRAVRAAGRGGARAPHARARPTRSRRSRWARSAAEPAARRAVRDPADERGAWSPSASGSRPYLRPRARQDDRLHRGDGLGAPHGEGPVVYAARCIPRS